MSSMIADWLPNLLLAWGVQATGVASPGPGVALILGVATSQGRGPALRVCLGIGLAAILMALGTLLGLAVIWSEIASLMIVVKLIGTTYLAWLAWGAFRKAASPTPPPEASSSTGRGSILQGFLMQLVNPKAMFFWLAVAALAGLNTAPLPILVAFLSGAFMVSFGGHGLWAVALSSTPFRRLYARGRRWVEGFLGAFFAFAAFKLATSRT